MHGNTIAWGDANGNVDYLELDLSKIPQRRRDYMLGTRYKWMKPTRNVATWKRLLWRMRIRGRILALKLG
jgi:hypothetical protein